MNKFQTISSIKVDDKTTWKDSIFLTLDIDWAHDDVLTYAIELVERADVAATWYVTHDTPLLERLRQNPKFELGIHPNFNFLLEGDGRNGNNAYEVVNRILSVVPEAKSVRSHHMTQSSGLIELFKKFGLTHDVNQFIPNSLEFNLCPWFLWNGLIRVPYSWEDDIHILYESRTIQSEQREPDKLVLNNNGLKVFDFHPIHIFMNTESLERYERTRPLHHKSKELIKHRFDGYGTHSRLINLLKLEHTT
jgi:hypothetical protein